MNWLKKLITCLFCWKIPAAKASDLLKIDAIIGASFGLPYNGVSNKRLAEIIGNYMTKFKKPILVQWELADCLLYFEKAYIVKAIPGKYLDSYQIAQETSAYCKKMGWTKVAVVAYKHQQLRLGLTLQEFGLQVVYIETTAVPCDPKSTQFWTRSPWIFIPREIVGRLLFLATKKM